ncbi:uncharacterized protein LOC114386442 [Glycine soja]|uniref:uncharacterized protein LOC114386442 n=1 Tax=Glycine soja TaxID=3848 RepID=UPI00103CDF79|nr:uncharacterized protein LOC114386442 [Glycine soja]
MSFIERSFMHAPCIYNNEFTTLRSTLKTIWSIICICVCSITMSSPPQRRNDSEKEHDSTCNHLGYTNKCPSQNGSRSSPSENGKVNEIKRIRNEKQVYSQGELMCILEEISQKNLLLVKD